MKANELRIGNYVYDRSRKTLKVDRWENPTQIASRMFIDDMEVHPFTEYIDELKPIQLSEEWLLKFGWVWNDECNSYEKYPNGDARMNLSHHSINNSYTMFNYILKATIAERIWYVHQLQNLYYALTGEELTIKSE